MPVDSRPLCAYCRTRAAEAFLHGDRRGEYWLICFDCVEALIERENAVHIAPALRETLPALWDREPSSLPRMRPPVRDDSDYDKLRAIREQWERSNESA